MLKLRSAALFLLLAGCSGSGCAGVTAQSALSDSAIETGHALAAVREAYLVLCSDESDAGPASDKCAKAKAAFNKADEVYTKVNDSL